MRVGVALISAAAVLGAGPAAATSPSITLTPSTVHRGHVVRVSGSAGDCPRGDVVVLISRAFPHERDFAGLPAVYATVRRRHRYAKYVRIPRSRRPGHYAVSGRCGGGSFGKRATLTVKR